VSPDAPDRCDAAAPTRPGSWTEERLADRDDVDWYSFTTTADRNALITLGALGTDVAMGLYSSCGRPLEASDRPGLVYEEIARLLPAGTYRVGVSSSAGAGGGYVLRFRSLPQKVVILSSRTFIESSRRRVVGEVLNASARAREHVSVRILFYDDANDFLGDAQTTAVLGQIGPGQRSMFLWRETETDRAPRGTRAVRVVVADAPAVSESTAVGVVARPLAPRTEYGGGVFEGTLRNTTHSAIRGYRVTVTLYDARGGVLNAGWAAARSPTLELAPGAEVGYRIDLLTQWSGASRVAYSAYAERAPRETLPRPGMPTD
jgi:hypothetical protein